MIYQCGNFESFFRAATGLEGGPYPYQVKLASEAIQSRLMHVPTGCGKTAAAILSWLWRRKIDPQNTPRRVVYGPPTRLLVGLACDWERREIVQ